MLAKILIPTWTSSLLYMAPGLLYYKGSLYKLLSLIHPVSRTCSVLLFISHKTITTAHHDQCCQLHAWLPTNIPSQPAPSTHILGLLWSVCPLAQTDQRAVHLWMKPNIQPTQYGPLTYHASNTEQRPIVTHFMHQLKNNTESSFFKKLYVFL